MKEASGTVELFARLDGGVGVGFQLRHAVHDDLAVLPFLLLFLYPSLLDAPLSGAGGVPAGPLGASAGMDAPLVIAVDANLKKEESAFHHGLTDTNHDTHTHTLITHVLN